MKISKKFRCFYHNVFLRLLLESSVLDKPYNQYISIVEHFWSGKQHRVVKGINFITLYYTISPEGTCSWL